jgi:rhodanese-related sulfurtransferase
MMQWNKSSVLRLFLETALLCFLGFGLGLIINYQIVSQGVDGSLTAEIKETLKNQIEEKARKPDPESGAANIIILDHQQAKDLCENGQALFVDARPAGAYAEGHIQGAINITEQTLDDHLFDLMDMVKETRIIIYCTNPECPQAMELAELLAENDIRPAYVYTGGWDQWVEMGYPATNGEGP